MNRTNLSPKTTEQISQIPLPTYIQQTRGYEPWKPVTVIYTLTKIVKLSSSKLATNQNCYIILTCNYLEPQIIHFSIGYKTIKGLKHRKTGTNTTKALVLPLVDHQKRITTKLPFYDTQNNNKSSSTVGSRARV